MILPSASFAAYDSSFRPKDHQICCLTSNFHFRKLRNVKVKRLCVCETERELVVALLLREIVTHLPMLNCEWCVRK